MASTELKHPDAMKIINLFLITLLISSGTADACIRWNKGAQSFDELIDQTNQIVLARFWCNDKQIPRCGFTILEYLKNVDNPSKTTTSEWADVSKWLQMANDPVQNETANESTDFEGHSDSKFWFREVAREKKFGRGDCHAEFSFKAEKEYLIFIDSIGSRYSAELVERRDDAWIKYVKARLTMARTIPLSGSYSVPAEIKR